jgi:hypothetical protein
MWKKGTLARKRLVLRPVFLEPLAYDRGKGFQTASFSQPIAFSCIPELDEMEVVDQIRKSSNRLVEQVQEWAALIGGLHAANKGGTAA